MKKIMSFLFAILLVLSCAACSSNGNGGEGTPSTTSSQTQGTELTGDDTTSKPDDVKLDGVAYVGGKSITINYNASRRYDNKSDSLVFHSQLSNAIVLTYDDSSSYAGSVDGVFDILNDGDLFNDISTYTGTAFAGQTPFKINVSSSENVSVAGFDSVRINGNVTDANGKIAVVYAYTFVIDDTPCMLAGVIIDEATNGDVVTAVKAEVDMMAKTVKEA